MDVSDINEWSQKIQQSQASNYENAYTYLIVLFTNKGAVDIWNFESLLHNLTLQT